MIRKGLSGFGQRDQKRRGLPIVPAPFLPKSLDQRKQLWQALRVGPEHGDRHGGAGSRSRCNRQHRYRPRRARFLLR